MGQANRPPAPTVPQSDPDRQGNHAHSQLVEGSALLPREIDAPDSFSAGARHRIPFNERASAEQTVVSRSQEVSTDSEQILHDTVNRREPLELSGRLETPHLALTLSGRLMGDLRAVIRVLIRCSEAPTASPCDRRPSNCAACR